MLDVSFKKNLGEFVLDISFQADNEILVLFGPSGSGKSLTLKIISGLIRPDSGHIRLNNTVFFDSDKGIDISVNKRGVGYVFQDYALFPHMNVFENIAYGIRGMGGVKERASELQRLLRLEGAGHLYPYQLSGGQRQRVAIARSIASEPAILLLDEPLSALDYPVRTKIRGDLIAIHKRFRIPTILVTHDTEDAFVLGERIAVMEGGKIEQIGRKEDVFYRPGTRKVAKLLAVKNIFNGIVKKRSQKDSTVSIESDGFNITANLKDDVNAGSKVEFCIRPEDIKIVNAEGMGQKAKGKGRNRENIISARVFDIQEKGLAHTVLAGLSDDDYLFQINLSNSACRNLKLKKGMKINISLPKDLVWII